MNLNTLSKKIGHLLGKSIVGIGMLAVVSAFALAAIHTFAAGSTPPLGKSLGPAGAGIYNTGDASTIPVPPSVGGIVAQVIAIFFGFLGIIFVCLMVYGGFQWMTAAGNPDQVKKAQKLMMDAVLGLLILMAASFISYWVLYTISTKIVTST